MGFRFLLCTFFVVHAYLTSKSFAELVVGKKLCIVISEYDEESCRACRSWFIAFGRTQDIVFVEISDAFVATRWGDIKAACLEKIPSDTDLYPVGTGIGSLLVCVYIAEVISVPTIYGDHVMNMMNSRLDKSNRHRLYTIRSD